MIGRAPLGASRRRRGATLAMLAAALITGACSSDDDAAGSSSTSVADGRPLSDEEASVLADILVRNHDAGGAAVSIVAPYGDATFTFDGDVDWTAGVASLVLHVDLEGEEPPEDRRLAYTANTVLEEVPGLAQRLVERGSPPVNWVARPMSTGTSPLDVILNLVLAAASTTRENPVLLAQDGARWLRTDTVDVAGTAVEVGVFSTGQSRFFVDANGDLLRQEADLAATGSTVVLEFGDRGPRTALVPDDGDVVDIAEVQDLYDELGGR